MDQRDELRQAFPSYGADWDAAIDYGIDVSLLEENLRLTPSERIEQLQRMIDLHFAQQAARESKKPDAADR
ncbi:MAG: hypothetical protein ACYC8T_28375 [Myxococcaceae bacterium]